MSELHTRKEKRTPVTLKIKFKSATLDQFIERYSVDVSQGGIFIRTKDPLAVGTQLRFEFQLQDASPLIGGEGTVVWTREFDPSRTGVAPGMGVRFDRLAPESQAVLEQILQRKVGGKPVDSAETTAVAPPEKTRIAPQNLVNSLASQSRLPSPSAATPPVSPPLPDKPVLPKGLHGLVPPRGGFGDEPSRDQTPLPKPMPFHVGGDEEFSEDVFEQPTKVASLENLLKHEEEQARAAQAAEAAAAAAAALRQQPHGADLDDEEQTAVTLSRPPRSASEMRAVVPAPEPNAPPVSAPFAPEPAFVHAPAPVPIPVERRSPSGERRPVAPAERRQPSAAQRALATAPTAAMGVPVATPSRQSSPRVSIPQRMESPPPAALPVAAAAGRRSNLPYIIAPVVLLAAAAALYFLVIHPGDEDAPQARPPLAKKAATDDNLGTPPPPAPPPILKPAVAAPTPAPAAKVDVTVKSTPVGAQVMVDGVAHGSTPTTLGGLEQGRTYQVALNAACFKSEKVMLAAAPGASIEVKLTPLERVVHVVSDPPGASVIVDGKAAGRTPADVRLVGKVDPRAPHTFALRRPGFEDAQTTVSPDSPCATEGDIGAVGLSVSLTPLAKKVVEPPAAAKPAPAVAPPTKAAPKSQPEPAKPEPAKVSPPEPVKATPVSPPPEPPPPPPKVEPPPQEAEPAPVKAPDPEPPPAKPEPKAEAKPEPPPAKAAPEKKAEPASNKDCDPSPDAPEWARCK